MRHPIRITTVALAGAFALSALAAPAVAHVPHDVKGTVDVLNNAKVCVPGLDAAGIGVQVPIASPESANCTQQR
ncbi:hypothetical protein ACBJ59_22840 [Nonomuraea sp. MTCD27]|uniref:hypothetical protein n=1 Tax=Nonomuraea sp. MTCD27 TaxID=1676747 RepID=UPI0035C07609